MKCPYCAREIPDDAAVCPECGRELFYGPLNPILGRIAALEQQTSGITERLDEIVPLKHDMIEERISDLRKQVEEITKWRESQRPSDQRASPQRNQQDSKQGDQQKTDQGVVETRKHPFRIAGRYLVDSYTAEDTDLRRIGLALLLAVVVAILDVQIVEALGQGIDLAALSVERENDPGQAALTLGRIIVDSVYAVGVILVPFMCGFFTSLSWPGRRTLGRVMSLVLLGVFAALLIWFITVLLFLFGGTVLSLPTIATEGGHYYKSWQHVVENRGFTAVTLFSVPLSAFVSGGLLADSVKIPKFSLSQRRGLAYTFVSALTRRGREPNRRLVWLLDKLPAILFALLPLVVKNLDTIRKLGQGVRGWVA
jgi:hypothetical protein